MEATVLDLRRRTSEVLRALERGERVTITYRGQKKGVIIPEREEPQRVPVKEDEAFGMWADREDLQDVPAFVRSLRKQRY